MNDNDIKSIIMRLNENNDENLNNIVFDVVKKIIELPLNTETTIAKLIDYNAETNFVDPLQQGIINNLVEKVCKTINIELDYARDSFGGLAFHYPFKKVMDANKKNNEINEEMHDNKLNEKYIQKLFDKNSFFLEIYSGAVLPMNHPNYYNGRKEISLNRSYNNIHSTIKIEKNDYSISNDVFNKVEEIVKTNFDKLLEVAKRQSNEMYDGIIDSLNIKVGSILIMLSSSNATNEEDFNYINLFINQIVDLLKQNN